MKIVEDENIKVITSPEINHIFNKKTGDAYTWGQTKQDDPDWCPYGPLILDVEVSTICNNGCTFCYKSNTSTGLNMSLETFKVIFDKLPRTVTQIAFGIGDISANPDLFKIFDYCRKHGVVPNVTINGYKMTPELYDELVEYCGAVAVSLYDYDTCYNAVAELSKRGLKQVNIHALLSKETYWKCIKVVDDKKVDPRLKGLRAIVFLALKPKGERNVFHQLESAEAFDTLISHAVELGVGFGFDSCSAPRVMDLAKRKYNYMETYIEPCESTGFSYYINAEGKGFPCSFSEDLQGYKGVDVLGANDFVKDVWLHPETQRFRESLQNNKDENGCRNCPLYKLGGCKQ